MEASSTTTLSGIKPIGLTDSSSVRARLGRTAKSLSHSPAGMVGLLIVLIILCLAVFGPAITPHDATQHNLRARFKPPGFVDSTGSYILGTDQLGRDILSRIIIGCRVSVTIGVVTALLAGLIGVVYGVIAGFFGGWVDTILSRIMDALLGIPFIVLVVAVAGIVGAGLGTIILILALTGWVTYARVVRSEVLVVRELEYVMAARVIGQSNLKIMFRYIIPNVLASAIVLGALQVGTVILAESSLSFLGLGVQSPEITWGIMLADGRQYIGSAWWMTTFPGVAITITVLGVVLLGDWLRDLLDPRLRV